ncbi:MAG: class 1 fructose-bisphosphatase [Chloroflexota bacterium]
MAKLITIERHIQEQQAAFPQATGTFTRLLQDMALSAKLIANQTTRAGLVNILGSTDEENVFGETQQKLDIYADDVIYRMNDHTGRLAGVVSEEHDGIRKIPDEYVRGNYVLVYDPLDGSSNIDVNTSIGTIFSIHRKFTKGEDAVIDDVLQEGKRLVAAGYVIYGSSTMMIYTTGQGVYGFTLDPSIGEFVLSHPDITVPDEPRYYSVNHGYQKYWTEGVRHFVRDLQGLDGNREKPLHHRYIGSMVSDFHRNLLKGGIFIYPGDTRDDRKFGKIRLLHEAQALAFVLEQAGGYSSDGVSDVLDINPNSIEQTVPVFMGNRREIELAEKYIKEYDYEWLREYAVYRSGVPIEQQVLKEAKKKQAANSNDASP